MDGCDSRQVRDAWGGGDRRGARDAPAGAVARVRGRVAEARVRAGAVVAADRRGRGGRAGAGAAVRRPPPAPAVHAVLAEDFAAVEQTEAWRFLRDHDPWLELDILQFLEDAHLVRTSHVSCRA